MTILRKCIRLPGRLSNCKGQVAVEFMLVLPFFLMFLFTVILLTFLVIFSEVTTYATFWGARAASVGAELEVAQQAARSVLPGIELSISGGQQLRVEGKYNLTPLIGRTSEGGNLSSPLARFFELKTSVTVSRFAPPTTCSNTDDNPVNGEC